MTPSVNPARCCPECRSKEYVFRGRKTLPAEEDRPAAVETKYLCRECGHAWK
jgi:DNA-directed RNA polymerase subunit M/transcription elongation factor TFIIS